MTRAVTDEIESYRGVSSADARMIGHADDLTLVVTATVEDTADLPALRERIESEALAHARAALDDPELPIQLDLTVATGQSARVQ